MQLTVRLRLASAFGILTLLTLFVSAFSLIVAKAVEGNSRASIDKLVAE